MLTWTPELSVHVREIDEQHQKFIGLLNDLTASIDHDGGKSAADEHLGALEDYALLHFATEEKYFEKFGYPGAQEHVEEHRRMLDQLRGYRRDLERGEDVIGVMFAFAANWLVDHLRKMDMKYGQWFNDHGLF